MNIRIFLEFFFIGISANLKQNVSLIFLEFFYLMTYTGFPVNSNKTFFVIAQFSKI
jgi:hypothetical protein